jgi:beta-N-acetylhexosaminidase
VHLPSVEAVLNRMSLQERIGQLFVVAVGRHSPNALRLPPDQRVGEVGLDPPDQVAAQVRDRHVGGVCYFPTSAAGDDPGSVAGLLADLQRTARDSGTPLLFSVDQEGGTVARLRRGVTGVPGAMALAATGDPGAAERAATITGTELRAIGFHQDYAPSADVNVDPANPVIGVRSYGSDPTEVAGYVAAAVRGLRATGIAATVKHFPGHGDTSVDSHLDLPTVTHDRARWEEVDLPPFATALAAGADAVMTAHLALPSVDPGGAPATASAPLLTGILRGRLGFDGPVVTDALDMAGARRRYGDEIAVHALAAGADQLLMPADLDAAIAAVTAAVRTGRIPASRVDSAVRRTLRLKARLGILDGSADVTFAADRVGTEAHRAAAWELALRGITVLGRPDRLPVDDARVALVGCLSSVGDALRGRLRPAETADTGSDPDSAAIAGAVATARRAQRTVVVTRSAWRWPGQRALLDALAAAGAPHVLVAVREPYDAGVAPAAEAAVLSYGDSGVAVEALAHVLVGAARGGGRLPVDVPGPDGRIVHRKGAGG